MNELAIHPQLNHVADWNANRRGLPSEDREAQLLWRLRYQVTRTQLRQLFTTARLRTFLVIGLSLFFWAGLFLLFYAGFQFIVVNIAPPAPPYPSQPIPFL